MTTQLLAEAQDIVDKKELVLKDYQRFNDIGDLIQDDELRFYYDNLAEAFEIRLPEIAAKVGSYSFIKDDV